MWTAIYLITLIIIVILRLWVTLPVAWYGRHQRWAKAAGLTARGNLAPLQQEPWSPVSRPTMELHCHQRRREGKSGWEGMSLVFGAGSVISSDTLFRESLKVAFTEHKKNIILIDWKLNFGSFIFQWIKQNTSLLTSEYMICWVKLIFERFMLNSSFFKWRVLTLPIRSSRKLVEAIDIGVRLIS